MNYTEKYHLPQWVKEDRIMMEDFNEAMARIENGIAGAAEKPYVIGSYKGTTQVQEVTLGFRPSALLVLGQYTGDNKTYANFDGIITENFYTNKIHFTDTGFVVHAIASRGIYPMFNENGRDYIYIALK